MAARAKAEREMADFEAIANVQILADGRLGILADHSYSRDNVSTRILTHRIPTQRENFGLQSRNCFPTIADLSPLSTAYATSSP
jgi:hypothetical protein